MSRFGGRLKFRKDTQEQAQSRSSIQYMHVVAVMYRKQFQDVAEDKKMTRSPNWHGGCSQPCYFQLAITILPWSVVMEYQQRCFFLVDLYNRTANQTMDLTHCFVLVCLFFFHFLLQLCLTKVTWVWSKNIHGHLVDEFAVADYGTGQF